MKQAATVSWFSREIFFPQEEMNDWGDIEIGVDAISERYDGKGVSVAILDTGVDRRHPDLSVSAGINLVSNQDFSNFQDDYGHGTFVAGVLACLKNQKGLIGVCPRIRLLAVRIGQFNEQTRSFENDVVEALEKGVNWAIDNKADIINLSMEFQTISNDSRATLEAVFQNAVNHGVLLVAATGNGGRSEAAYPASSKFVLGVGALGSTKNGGLLVPARIWDQKGYYYVPWTSNYGKGLDVLAPGVRVPSSLPTAAGANYAWGNGTSIAAPYVSGVCAILLEADKTRRSNTRMYVEKVYKVIRESAQPLLGITAFFQGSGIVNIPRALQIIKDL